MTGIKHAFVSAKADGGDATLVRPVDWNAEHVGSNILDRFIEFIPWVTLDGFLDQSVGGAIVLDTPMIDCDNAGGMAGNHAYIRTKMLYYDIVRAGKTTKVDWIFHQVNYLGDVIAKLYFTPYTASPPSDTADHFGFRIADNGVLYATNAHDGTQKQTSTGITLTTTMQRRSFRAELTEGINCKFYVDNVLKVTHTENLPTYTYYHLNMGNEVITGSGAPHLYLGRVLIEAEY